MRCWLGGLVALGFPVLVAAQGTEPLRKTDLIRLLANPMIRKGEVASAVRRNCLAFRPTERDWADLRGLDAAPEVVASIAGCAVKPAPLAPSAESPVVATNVQVVLRQARISAAAGSRVSIAIIAARGGIPQAGVRLVLRG